MSVRMTMFLLVVAVVMVSAALFTERTVPIAAQRRAAISERALDNAIAEADLVRVELERESEGRWVFERTVDGFQQVEPFLHRVGSFSIRRFAADLAALRSTERLDPEDDDVSLSALGLDPPRAIVRMTTDDGRTLEVRLGRLGIGGRAYLQLEAGGAVHVVGPEYHQRVLTDNPAAWRERRLFRAVGVESDRIEIERPDGRVVLVRDRRTWRMEEPVRTRMNPDARDELMSVLGRVQSAGFILDDPDDLAPFGLTTPAGSVVVKTTRRREVDGAVVNEPIEERVIVGNRVGAGTRDRFGLVDGQPVVVRLPAAFLQALFGPAELLADPAASGVLPADIKRVRISTEADEFDLERDVDTWRLQDGPAVTTEVVESLLKTLTSARATSIRFSDWPRDLEIGMVIFYGWDQAPMDTVRLGRDATGALFMENGDRVLRFHPEALELPLTREAYGLTP